MTTVATTRYVDPKAVEAALRIILTPGQVTELRALDAITASDRRPHTFSGYFDEPAKLAQAAARIKSAKGIYFTPNPVKPALLARAMNRARAVGKEPTTSDHDIERRAWLLIDCDAVRPAGVSASDDEHEAAIAKAGMIRAALTDEGWPEPIFADSGNGAHLLYRVDLPADDGGLVERCLLALAERFDDAAVTIDRKVFNPARIWKLYGTLAGKGDPEAAAIGRPQRMAAIIDTPGELRVASRELLEATAAQAPKAATTTSTSNVRPAGQAFDVLTWMSQHEIETTKHKPYRGGDLWELAACPFNADHVGGCAHVSRDADGRLGFACKHASCAGKDWHAFRARFDGPRDQRGGSGHGHADHAEPAGDPWPDSLAEEAFHGVAGDIVRAIEPHSEADPVALLTQLLVGFGNLIHLGPHFVAEGDWHAAKLNVCMVGVTSKGRKGSSWSQTRRVLASVDPDWAKTRILSGLSSGEGLIWQVRDPIWRREPIREKKQIVGYQDVEVDPGVADKRLLVLETELGSVLRVLRREGNTLSPVIRDAWDRSDLSTLTKNSPAKSTGCHISIVGHITRDELRRHISETDLANGLANRFLWLCVRRSKCLPEGGALHTVDFAPAVNSLKSAAEFAQGCGELRRDADARAIWAAVYPQLSEGRPGLLGAATSRAEAQTMRLAIIYALLDCSPSIRAEHLLAGLAIWKYAEQSARHIFGSALGDPTADELLRLLRAAGTEGLTRTEINNALGRHVQAAEIGRALGVLAESGLARSAKEQPDGGGRPTIRWFAP